MLLIKYNIIILFCFAAILFFFRNLKKKDKQILNLSPKFIPNKNNKNVLVMFSGGLDSTTALYYFLKETDYNVYVHHVILKDATDRWKDELNACKNIVDILKQIRNFNYSESTFHLPLNSLDKYGGYRDDDNTTILFIASKIFSVESYKDIDFIVIGNLDCEMDTKTKQFMNDYINLIYLSKPNTKKPKLINPLSKFNSKKCHYNKNVIKKLIDSSNTLKLTENQNLDFSDSIFDDLICTKKNMFNYLKNNLKNKIVYCRYPKVNQKCGKCFNCILYNEVI